MIVVRNIGDNPYRVTTINVLETAACERVQELMVSDHVKLSWRDNRGFTIHAGAYIEYGGEPFYLLDDYNPTQNSEEAWTYEPEFQSFVMILKKIPFFMYTTEGTTVRKETDWTLTANAKSFIQRVAACIENETGESYEVVAPEGEYKSLSFNSVDVFSALNSIADAFELEWWLDKDNMVVHLGKCVLGGSPVTLEVGANINVPSVTANTEGYYNRFYVFGSTRNIVQKYNGANVNNLVNKRLTLDPEVYPDGYYEPTPLTEGEQPFSKILIFEDIYPAATNYVAYDIIWGDFFTLDDDGNRIQIGTDEDNNPIYDMYRKYFFKLGYKKPNDTYEQFFLNNWNYSDKEERQGGDQPGEEGMLIEGLKPSVHFSSGALQGREFEVKYYDQEATIVPADGTPIIVPEGYFEILFIKEGNYVIPDQLSLSPEDDDKAILFNIKMPDGYIEDAYARLEEKMLDTIEEKYESDRNQYTFTSNPVAFDDEDPELKIGSPVTFLNGNYSLETRVVKIVAKVDYPVKQTITIGNSLVKGAIQEIKENVVDTNRNLDIIATLNSTTKTIADAYSRTQQIILTNFARWADFFTLDTTSWPGHTLIKAGYDGFYSSGPISAGGYAPGGGGGGGGAARLVINGIPYNASEGVITVTQQLLPKDGGIVTGNLQVNGNIVAGSIGSSDSLSISSGGLMYITSDGNEIHLNSDVYIDASLLMGENELRLGSDAVIQGNYDDELDITAGGNITITAENNHDINLVGNVKANGEVIPVDSNLVHKTGNESIYGTKTFNGVVAIRDDNGYPLKLFNLRPNDEAGDKTTHIQFFGVDDDGDALTLAHIEASRPGDWMSLGFWSDTRPGYGFGLKDSDGTFRLILNWADYEILHSGLKVWYNNFYNLNGNTGGAALTFNKTSDYFGIGPNATNPENFSLGLAANSIGSWKSYFMTFDNSGNVGIGTVAPRAKLHVLGGRANFEIGNGSANIDSSTWAVMVGPSANRMATIGDYFAGVAFNHMTEYESHAYENIAHGWIGLRLHSMPGSELSYLVFATKPGTGTSGAGNDLPIERMCIAPDGKVGIGTQNPLYVLHVVGGAYIDGQLIVSELSVEEVLTSNITSYEYLYVTSAADINIEANNDISIKSYGSDVEITADNGNVRVQPNFVDLGHTPTAAEINAELAKIGDATIRMFVDSAVSFDAGRIAVGTTKRLLIESGANETYDVRFGSFDEVFKKGYTGQLGVHTYTEIILTVPAVGVLLIEEKQYE